MPDQPRWDITPPCASPHPDHITRAKKAIAETLNDFPKSEYGEQVTSPSEKVVRADKLVHAVVEKGTHGRAAAEWAVFELAGEGRLKVEPCWVPFAPWVGGGLV